ncbi:MAG: hypothetical protein RIR95_1331, partial [Pseudomonadota bacterium]
MDGWPSSQFGDLTHAPYGNRG